MNGKTIQAVIVTGISGAGKTSALKALEDMNFEAIDNVPLSMLESLMVGAQLELGSDAGSGDHKFARPVAIGIDIRTRDFGVEVFLDRYDQITERQGINARIVFIDCDDEELKRRYEETRHRHPLALDRPVADGIAHERKLVSPLRDRANLVIETTTMGPGGLKNILQAHFAPASEPGLTVFITSFSFRRGLPREADLVFDARFLRNPHYTPELRPLNGRDAAVGDFIGEDEAYEGFFGNVTNLLEPLLPRFIKEGKSYLTIAVGCTGGRHRSVFIAEQLTIWFEKQGWKAQLHHRDIGG
ncbi:MAG: RNase adapter RapZ [Rhodospirillales bacterium]|mgnify:FL=1|nr:RNase adapter RapZ [Rhodospirillales bacterium]